MNKADFHKSKPNPNDWLGLLARIHQGRVEVANLSGLRMAEEQSIRALDLLDDRMESPGSKLMTIRLKTRFQLDTGELTTALESSRKLVELAREVGGDEDLASALSWQAMIHRERSENETAVKLYTQAEALMVNKLSLAEVWQEKGLTYTYLGQYLQAEELLTRALAVFRSIGSNEKIATAVNDLGVCFYLRGNYRRSLELFQEAIALYLRIGYKLGSATTASNLASCHLNLGDIGLAISLAERCLEWGREIEDGITVGRGHEVLGSVYKLLCMPERALDHLKKAEECANKAGDFVVSGMMLGLQAEVLAESGRAGEAEVVLSRAEELGRETGDEMLAFRMAIKRAWLTPKLSDYESAVERWNQLIRRAEDKADRRSASEARLEKAACLLAMGEIETAKRCFEEIAPDEDSSIFWLLRHQALGVEMGKATEDEKMTQDHCSRARKLAGQLLETNQEQWIRERLLSIDPLKKLKAWGCL